MRFWYWLVYPEAWSAIRGWIAFPPLKSVFWFRTSIPCRTSMWNRWEVCNFPQQVCEIDQGGDHEVHHSHRFPSLCWTNDTTPIDLGCFTSANTRSDTDKRYVVFQQETDTSNEKDSQHQCWWFSFFGIFTRFRTKKYPGEGPSKAVKGRMT